MRSETDYLLQVEIGRGDYTTVSIATRPQFNQLVAIKQLHDTAGKDADQSRRLRDCLGFLAGLSSYDHIVRPLDFVPDSGWLVLELMHGSVAERLKVPNHPLTPSEVRGILRDALRGLAVIHAAGRCHGFLKPSNLLFDSTGRVKIADSPGLFSRGVARPPHGALESKYAAPERFDPSFGDIGPASDLYALGFLTVELLHGPGFDDLFRPILDQASNAAAGWQSWHTSAVARLPAELRLRTLPRDLFAVLQRLLSKPVAGRCVSAEEALSELADVVDPPIVSGTVTGVPAMIPPAPEVSESDDEPPTLSFSPPPPAPTDHEEVVAYPVNSPVEDSVGTLLDSRTPHSKGVPPPSGPIASTSPPTHTPPEEADAEEVAATLSGPTDAQDEEEATHVPGQEEDEEETTHVPGMEEDEEDSAGTWPGVPLTRLRDPEASTEHVAEERNDVAGPLPVVSGSDSKDTHSPSPRPTEDEDAEENVRTRVHLTDIKPPDSSAKAVEEEQRSTWEGQQPAPWGREPPSTPPLPPTPPLDTQPSFGPPLLPLTPPVPPVSEPTSAPSLSLDSDFGTLDPRRSAPRPPGVPSDRASPPSFGSTDGDSLSSRHDSEIFASTIRSRTAARRWRWKRLAALMLPLFAGLTVFGIWWFNPPGGGMTSTAGGGTADRPVKITIRSDRGVKIVVSDETGSIVGKDVELVDLELKPGSYWVKLSKARHGTFEELFEFEPNHNRDIQITLTAVKAPDAFARGEDALMKGDIATAVAELTAATKAETEFAPAFAYLALARSLPLLPHTAAVQGDERTKVLRKALEECETAIRLDEDLAIAKAIRGAIRAELPPPENAEAEADCQEALRLVQDLKGDEEALAYRSLARVHLAQGKHEAALEDYDNAIQRTIGLVLLHLERGQLRFADKKPDGGIADYRDAIKLGYDHADLHQTIGRAYRQKHDFENAVKEMEIAARMRNDSPSWEEVAEVRLEVAEVVLEESKKKLLLPGAKVALSHAVFLAAGQSQEEMERLKGAEMALEEALASLRGANEPTQVRLRRQLGRYFREIGNPEMAIYHLKEALQLKKDDATLLNDRGFAYYRALKNEEAIADFTRVIDLLGPPGGAKDVATQKVLAFAYLKRGKTYLRRMKEEEAKAKADLKAAWDQINPVIAGNPNDRQARMIRAELYDEKQERGLAKEDREFISKPGQ